MKKFYANIHNIWYVIPILVISVTAGVICGIGHRPETFYLLIFSVLLSLLCLLFFINRIYISGDEIRIACVFHKGIYNIKDLKEMYFYYHSYPSTLFMAFCFNGFSEQGSLIFKKAKHCKDNPNIKIVCFLFQKKLLAEILSKNKDIKLTGPDVDVVMKKLGKN